MTLNEQAPARSRREFLKATAVAAPILLGCSRKTDPKYPVLGEGEFVYEAFHDWGELPGNIQYGNTHSVVEDGQGFIYVHHTVHETSRSDHAMVVYDPDGKFVTSWGSEFAGGAHGMQVRKEGSEEFLYLCDIERSIIVKTTLEGEEVLRIGYPTESAAYQPDPSIVDDVRRYDDQGNLIYSPTNLAVAPNGDIYVTDGYGTYFINHYDKDGSYIKTFGGPGSEPGQLICPHGIWLDEREEPPLLVVADRDNHRLQWFTLEGEHVRFAYGVKRPCHFDERDGVLLVPDLVSEVTLMDRQNEVIAKLGVGLPDAGERRRKLRDHFLPGKFIAPHGCCFDHDGNIFITEFVEIGRVTKLRRVV